MNALSGTGAAAALVVSFGLHVLGVLNLKPEPEMLLEGSGQVGLAALGSSSADLFAGIVTSDVFDVTDPTETLATTETVDPDALPDQNAELSELEPLEPTPTDPIEADELEPAQIESAQADVTVAKALAPMAKPESLQEIPQNPAQTTLDPVRTAARQPTIAKPLPLAPTTPQAAPSPTPQTSAPRETTQAAETSNEALKATATTSAAMSSPIQRALPLLGETASVVSPTQPQNTVQQDVERTLQQVLLQPNEQPVEQAQEAPSLTSTELSTLAALPTASISETRPLASTEPLETTLQSETVPRETPDTPPTTMAALPTLPSQASTATALQPVETLEPDVSPELEPAPQTEGLGQSLRPVLRRPSSKPNPDPKPEPKKAETAKPKPNGNAQRNATKGRSEGRATGTVARTAAKSGKSKEAGNAVRSNYRGLVLRKLQRAKRGKLTTKKRIIVEFKINPNGGLSFSKLIQKSGNARDDKLALSIVRRAAPYPKPPNSREALFTINMGHN